MKRILSIMVIMAIVMVSAFATTGDKIYITTTVAEVKPEFTMYGALSALDLEDLTDAAVAGAAKDETTTLVADPINANDIDVYIAILQTARATYKNTTGFTLSVTAGDLTGSNGGSVSPTIEAYDGDTPDAADGTGADFKSVVATHVAPTVSFTVKYPTGVPIAAGTLVGTVQFQYEHDDSLPVGSYQATITMTYTGV